MVNKQRLVKELKRISSYAPTYCDIGCVGNDVLLWKAIIKIPPKKLYSGTYDLSVQIPESYPMKPPKIKFNTKIDHWIVNDKGIVCLDMLHAYWTPAYKICQVIEIICSILLEPHLYSHLKPTKQNKNDVNMADSKQKQHSTVELLSLHSVM